MNPQETYQEYVKKTLIKHKEEYDFLTEEYAALHDIPKSIINAEKSKVIATLLEELL